MCDEGGYFYPPLGSKFELRPPGTSMFELQVDLAIQHGYWGMMPTTYCGAEHPLWENVPWLRAINGRFQSGRLQSGHFQSGHFQSGHFQSGPAPRQPA